MVARASIGIPVIFVSAFWGLAAPVARADEAYLCGPDTVIYVKAEELEHKKKTDKCIAAYYGLTVADEAAASISQPETAKSGPAKEKARPALELKSLSEPDQDVRRSTKFERSASLLPPMASPGTDFRNVRVINAGPDGSQWFKHAR